MRFGLSDPRLYNVQPGVTEEQIGVALVSYLQSKHGMEVEGFGDRGGYYIQARSPENAMKKIAGLSTAMIITLKVYQPGTIAIEVGAGEWGTKVGAGVVGMVVFPPLAAIPAFGAAKQAMLQKEVLDYAGQLCMSATPAPVAQFEPQPSPPSPESLVFAQDQVPLSTVESAAQGMTCGNCGSANAPGALFCSGCGTSLSNEIKCPGCGEMCPEGTRFCSACGCRIPQGNECPSCGEELQDGQRFCHSCGADTQA